MEEELCEQCGCESYEGMHPCPYLATTQGDYSECNCCEQCTNDCASQIDYADDDDDYDD